MKVASLAVMAGCILGVSTLYAEQTAMVEKDIAAFQGYFSKQFPGVALEAYEDGVNALPQYAHRRANWEILMEFAPFEPEMEIAREEWATPFNNGKTFSDCFKNNPAGNKYPYYDADTDDIRTVEGDINACLTANGEEPIKNLKNGKIARLVAAFREQFNGQPMAVDVSNAGAQSWYEKGRKFYWTKRGQLNFSCADCHVTSAGKNIRGDVLSAGLGHGTGFPVYRTKWAVAGKPWGTVHRRYDGCNKQVRAKPFKPQSAEYKALEYYEAVMNTGVPLKVPSQRQ
ncbi:MAG: sulfur oxidation c-type cytochrome SoxA [Gammaproteobacteria bacterium]|nr:sulfur oxidation c-type cytochrome SoxA [Gammaproteobacteria bacterium]